jgi:hypothetical protein
MAIWYIFHRFGTFLPVLVCCTKKNLATLLQSQNKRSNEAEAKRRLLA